MAYGATRRRLLLATALLGSLLTTVRARATYSIIALDVETGQVGGAGTSCVGSFSVYIIYGVAPGLGVVAAQASANTEARDRAVMLLADTLMLALEAGAENGEGDSRCTLDGMPSDGAFLEVNLPDQGTAEPFLHLQVDDTAPDSPLSELRAMYDAWRVAHPCPEPDETSMQACRAMPERATQAKSIGRWASRKVEAWRRRPRVAAARVA